MDAALATIIVALITAVPATVTILWHKRQAVKHWEKQELQNDEIITLVNGRLAKMLGGVEARLRALEAELRRVLEKE